MYTVTGKISSHLPESSSAAAVRNPTTPYSHTFHHHQETGNPITLQPTPPPYTSSSGGGGGADDDEFPRRDERSPQWSNQETRDFIEIRAQLELGLFTAPNNLWEMIADRMRGKGYRRTADQCKCKWQNLVNRYKGEEASDVDNVQPCPFFNELQAFFTMRANRMQQAQAGEIVKERRRFKAFSQEEEQEDEEEIIVVPKQKDGREKRRKKGENVSVVKGVEGMMRNFMVQQEMIDVQWRETMQKKAEEREALEQEWRLKMETLEREKIMMERAWREREEQRRLREERRAEKRDELLSTLLNKLIHDQSP